MDTITTSTGRKVSLEINDRATEVIANIGTVGVHTNVTFGVEQTATGFKSRFLVSEAGNKRLEVVLTGDDLDACRSLFASLSGAIKSRAADDDEYYARVNQILKAE